jgi:hypothetical protein
MKTKMLPFLVVALLTSACSPSPMDLCKQLASKNLVTKCHEYGGESKVSKAADFTETDGDYRGELTVYKNDDEYSAGCDLKNGRTLAASPKTRTCVEVDEGIDSNERGRQLKGDSTLMVKLKLTKLKDAVAAF